MTHYKNVKDLPVITMAEGKQVGKGEAKMDNNNYELDNNTPEQSGSLAGPLIGLLIGLLIGGLAGAVTMLLLAPHSGKRTRAKLVRQSHELREQTAETVEDAIAQARDKAHQITHDVRK